MRFSTSNTSLFAIVLLLAVLFSLGSCARFVTSHDSDASPDFNGVDSEVDTTNSPDIENPNDDLGVDYIAGDVQVELGIDGPQVDILQTDTPQADLLEDVEISDTVLQPDVTPDMGPDLIVPSQWEVAPLDGLAAIADPFDQDDSMTKEYTVTNTGTAATEVFASAVLPWVHIAPQSHLLSPGDSETFTVEVYSDDENGLPVGLLEDTVTFTDGVNQETRTVEVTVYNSGDLFWIRHENNPILTKGDPGSFDSHHVMSPTVLRKDDGSYFMWFSGTEDHFGIDLAIGVASSTDGIVWQKHSEPVLEEGTSFDWDASLSGSPSVVFDGATYHMYYLAFNATEPRIGYATSVDGFSFERVGTGPVHSSGTGEDIVDISVIYEDGVVKMWYAVGEYEVKHDVHFAESTDFKTFVPHPSNPVFPVDPGYEIQRISVIKDALGYRLFGWTHDGDQQYNLQMFVSETGTDWPILSQNTFKNNFLFNISYGWDSAIYDFSIIRDDEFNLQMWYGARDSTSDNEQIGHALASQPTLVHGAIALDNSVVCGSSPKDDCVGTLEVSVASACSMNVCGSSKNFNQDLVDLKLGANYWVANVVPGVNELGGILFEQMDDSNPFAKTDDLYFLDEVEVTSGSSSLEANIELTRLAPGPRTILGEVSLGPSIVCGSSVEDDCKGFLLVLVSDPDDERFIGGFTLSGADLSAGPIEYEVHALPAEEVFVVGYLREDGTNPLDQDGVPGDILNTEDGVPATPSDTDSVELNLVLDNRI